MPITAVPMDPARLTPGHNNSILSHRVMPPELRLPVGTNYGVLKPGMGQEPCTDRGSSKMYVPLEGQADLVTSERTYRLRRGAVYLIPEGTHHAVPQVGDDDFVNVCISWRHEPGSGYPDVLVIPFDENRLSPGHQGTIWSHGILPAEVGAPFGSAYGVLKPGMAQERAVDEPVSKLYVPLEGEADLVCPEATWRLQRGTVYFIPAGTVHEVRQVGVHDFVNVCVYWTTGAGP